MTYRRVEQPTEVVVIFKTHLRKDADRVEYAKASARMHQLVSGMPGFISIKGYRGEDGEEIDIVRFETEAALEAWRNQPEPKETQRRGRDEFYDGYSVQACRVFREYEFRLEDAPSAVQGPTGGP